MTIDPPLLLGPFCTTVFCNQVLARPTSASIHLAGRWNNRTSRSGLLGRLRGELLPLHTCIPLCYQRRSPAL